MATPTLFEQAYTWLCTQPTLLEHTDAELAAFGATLFGASNAAVLRNVKLVRTALRLSAASAPSPAHAPAHEHGAAHTPSMTLADEEPTATLDADEPTRDSQRYEHASKSYAFCIKGNDFDVPRDEVADLVWWYVRVAGDKTQRAVCDLMHQQHGRTITRDYMRRMLSVLGITKDSPPWAPHDLARHSAAELSALMYQRLRSEVELVTAKEAPREYKEAWQREAKLRRDQDRIVDALVTSMAGHRRVELPRINANVHDDTLAVLALYDAHFGKRTIRNGGLEESVRVTLDAGRQLMRRIAQWGAPSRVEVVLGGDTLHVDTRGGHTTRGTPQDVDRSTAEILRAGILATIDYVDMARQLAPVSLRIIPGNHDEILSFAILNALERHYQYADDVSVDVHHTTRLYTSHGSSLIMYEHGEGPKAGDLGAIMAREQPRAWGNSLYRYSVTGHLHHTHERDVGGITSLQVSTAAGTDAWHDKHGYTLADKAQRGFIFSASDGLIASVRAPKA